MKFSKLCDLDREGDHLYFSHEELEPGEKTFTNVNLDRCVFETVTMEELKLTGGRITRTEFRNCFLRNAAFDRVDLTGTCFRNCNLEHAPLARCNLTDVEFHDCELDYDYILRHLPDKPTQQQQLLRALRINAAEMGDADIADRLLLQERKAEKASLCDLLLGRNLGPDEHPPTLARQIDALRRIVGHGLRSCFWGYGVRPMVLLRSAVIIVLLFALLFLLFQCSFFRFGSGEARPLDLWESLYVSAATFVTIGFGDFAPAHWGGRVLTVLEGFCGLGFLASLAAVLYRRIRR